MCVDLSSTRISLAMIAVFSQSMPVPNMSSGQCREISGVRLQEETLLLLFQVSTSSCLHGLYLMHSHTVVPRKFTNKMPGPRHELKQ